MKKRSKGFTIIEIMVGILIFGIGITGIYHLLNGIINLNVYSKNSIVASNLAREGLEVVRNIRDSNYKQTRKWNIIKEIGNYEYEYFSTGVYFKVNPLNNEKLLEKIEDFKEGKNEIKGKMLDYALCLNSNNEYVHECSDKDRKMFFRYLNFEEVSYDEGGVKKIIPDTIKVKSKVIWLDKGYHEVELDTIFTNFVKQ